MNAKVRRAFEKEINTHAHTYGTYRRTRNKETLYTYLTHRTTVASHADTCNKRSFVRHVVQIRIINRMTTASERSTAELEQR